MQRVIARTVPVGPEGANRDLARDFCRTMLVAG